MAAEYSRALQYGDAAASNPTAKTTEDDIAPAQDWLPAQTRRRHDRRGRRRRQRSRDEGRVHREAAPPPPTAKTGNGEHAAANRIGCQDRRAAGTTAAADAAAA